MRRQMLDKVKEAEDFLKNGKDEDRDAFLSYMSRWIGYFQHERLIHLIVTMFFAFFSLMMLFSFLYFEELMLGLLFLIFGITTCFYIKHYYLLENKTQYLYTLYDKISQSSE